MEKKDVGLGIVSLVFGIWMFAMTTQMKSGPAFWPKIVAAGIIILGGIILVMGIMQVCKGKKAGSQAAKAETAKTKPQYGKVLAVVGILVLYFFAFQVVGYTIPTFLLICATSFVLGYRNWKVMIPTALIVSVGLYLSFTQLFGIHFPGMFF